MRCPSCGYVSFDRPATCRRCGAPLPARSGPAPAAGPAPREPDREEPPADVLELSEEDLAAASARAAPPLPLFRIDEDLLDEPEAAAPAPTGSRSAARGTQRPRWSAGEPPAAPAGVSAAAGGAEPVIDRDDEIPERFWAPEVAGLGRRAAAVLIDQALLAALLALFFASAHVALRATGFDTGLLLSGAGLRASLAPFAALAVLLSLAYHTFFHACCGRTPGKALTGVEVRAADGSTPSRGRVLLRWLGAALGLAAAGLGTAWALVEPRRRGWADLLSGTVVARRRRATTVGGAPLTSARPGGYHATAVQGRDSSAGRATD